MERVVDLGVYDDEQQTWQVAMARFAAFRELPVDRDGCGARPLHGRPPEPAGDRSSGH